MVITFSDVNTSEYIPLRKTWNVKDCSDILRLVPDAGSGLYPIHFEKLYCDMDTEGGGWTVNKIKSYMYLKLVRLFDTA